MSRFSPAIQAVVRRPIAPPAAARAFSTTIARRNVSPHQRSTLLPEFSLKDKVIVVSGGARGLGLVQAEAFLEAGATVHAIDRLPSPVNDPKSEFSAVSTRAREELGTSLTYHQADVRDNKHLNEIFRKIADENNRLDGIMAAAGINFETPALDYSEEEANRMMSINVTGCFMTVQAAARQMVRLKQPGAIAMVASMSAAVANRGMYAPMYNSSKAAVVQMCRSLAAEWGEYGIRVNTLSPGYIQTQMLQNLFDEYPERKAQWASENMLNRISWPKEFRGAGVFLLSDASSFMTGSDLRIDGGHTAW